MTGKPVRYADLIENMVSVDLVVRIERKNDVHTIANKIFDFSKITIGQLIKDGYEEALDQGTKILQDYDSGR
jgi:NTE family protein